MLATMRRLHPRGRASRGIAVDAEGAMLGPDCVLVRRTPAGFRCVAPSEARTIQAAVFNPGYDRDWLFEQSRRIAHALAAGEIALAQIYGLRISLGDLDDAALQRLAAVARLVKANFNPDEPRIPAGDPGAGQWTYGGDSEEPASSSGSSGAGGDGEPPPEAGGDDTGDDNPSAEDPIPIPIERPATAKERNSIVRRSAEWLRWAGAVGAVLSWEPRARLFFATLDGIAWILEYQPKILSYLDAPKSLEELENAVDDPQHGYENHHIVERHYRSIDPLANPQRFGDRLESRENVVRIPYWKHVEISSWYSTRSDDYGGMTPRAYLRGKSWDVQYEVGLSAMRLFRVLK